MSLTGGSRDSLTYSRDSLTYSGFRSDLHSHSGSHGENLDRVDRSFSPHHSGILDESSLDDDGYDASLDTPHLMSYGSGSLHFEDIERYESLLNNHSQSELSHSEPEEGGVYLVNGKRNSYQSLEGNVVYSSYPDVTKTSFENTNLIGHTNISHLEETPQGSSQHVSLTGDKYISNLDETEAEMVETRLQNQNIFENTYSSHVEGSRGIWPKTSSRNVTVNGNHNVSHPEVSRPQESQTFNKAGDHYLSEIEVTGLQRSPGYLNSSMNNTESTSHVNAPFPYSQLSARALERYFVQPIDLSDPVEDMFGYTQVCSLKLSELHDLQNSKLNKPVRTLNRQFVCSFVVRLWSRSSGRYVCILPTGASVYARAPFGPSGHLRMLLKDKDTVSFQSVRELRHHLSMRHGVLRGDGVGGPESDFRVLQNGDGYCAFESIAEPGSFMGVRENGNIMMASHVQPGAVHAQFIIQKEAADLL